jgi:hypothetical protein
VQLANAVMQCTRLDKAFFDFYNTRFALLNAIPITAGRTVGFVFPAPFATIQKRNSITCIFMVHNFIQKGHQTWAVCAAAGTFHFHFLSFFAKLTTHSAHFGAHVWSNVQQLGKKRNAEKIFHSYLQVNHTSLLVRLSQNSINF